MNFNEEPGWLHQLAAVGAAGCEDERKKGGNDEQTGNDRMLQSNSKGEGC